MNVKYSHIVFDGIDKSGKDLIRSYIFYMTNGKYTVTCRGMMSLIAYSKLYNRGYVYDTEKEKQILTVYITVNKQDWLYRCKATNEHTDFTYEDHTAAFEEAYKLYISKGYPIMKFNTSDMTPIQIAQLVVAKIEAMNNECN